MENEMLQLEIIKIKKKINTLNKIINKNKEDIQKLLKKLRKLELQILKLNIVYLTTFNKNTKQKIISAKDLKNETKDTIQGRKAEIIQLEFKKETLLQIENEKDKEINKLQKQKTR